MAHVRSTDTPWVLASLNNQLFAISAEHVQEMVISPAVASVPGTPEWMRGVVNLRGQVIPLVDLRKRLGRTSAVEETEQFCSLMDQREQDHKKWLAELESSVREQREFKLATDPHRCAFGQWYYNYQTPNLLVAAILKKFEEPHKSIHALAVTARTLMAQGQTDRALQLIGDAHNGVLHRLIGLFAELRQLIRESQREIGIIIRLGSQRVALAVDSVESVERLEPGSIEDLQAAVPGLTLQSAAKSIGRRVKTGQVALILDVESLAEVA